MKINIGCSVYVLKNHEEIKGYKWIGSERINHGK